MNAAEAFFQWSELDRTSFPELRDQVLRAEQEGVENEPRSYPGYPRYALETVRVRRLTALEVILRRRRSKRDLQTTLPSRRVLSRLLQFSHRAQATDHCGPIPSAGGLQAVELYLVVFEQSWLSPGLYHYDRVDHSLARVRQGADRVTWAGRVPSLHSVMGGALLWVVVGDGRRVTAKYGARGYRFLLLEAGHLMQNLCLLSASLGLCTVPLGGFLEKEIARQFALPASDVVLYAGVCGGERNGNRDKA